MPANGNLRNQGAAVMPGAAVDAPLRPRLHRRLGENFHLQGAVKNHLKRAHVHTISLWARYAANILRRRIVMVGGIQAGRVESQ